MQTRHFVEKSGYWVYDAQSKTLRHQHIYPTSNLNNWIYASSQGHVLVEDDNIVDFYPIDDIDNFERNELMCFHVAKEYVGFTDRFMFCTKCGVKL